MSITWKGETLYKVAEVARIFRLTPQTVHSHIRSGKLAARLVLGVLYVADAEITRVLSQGILAKPVTTTAAHRREVEEVCRRLEAAGW